MGKVRKVITGKRKLERWEARADIYDEHGKRHTLRARRASKEDAERWLRETEQQSRYGTPYTADVTLAEWHAIWYPRKCHSWATSTQYIRRTHWKKHIEPRLGKMKLRAIRRHHCQALVDALVSHPYKPRQVRSIIEGLQGMLRDAVREDRIPRNPASDLDLPRIEKTNPAIWSLEQVQAFLAATKDHPDSALYHLILSTGMRLGEALALSWDHVDLQRGTIQASDTLRRTTSGRFDIGPGTKSGHRGRTIPLVKDAQDALTRHRDAQRAWCLQTGFRNHCNLVFPGITGHRPRSVSHTTNKLKAAVKASGLPMMTSRNWRHTAATVMLSEGVPMKVVQEILGHATMAMTADTYSHVTESLRRSGVDIMERALSGATTLEAKTAEKHD